MAHSQANTTEHLLCIDQKPALAGGTMSRRNFLMSGVVFSATTAMGSTVAMAQESSSEVKTSQGGLKGVRDGQLNIWRGIPYAAPPVGENRWRAPQPPESWDGVRDATEFGPACLQKVARNEPEHSLKDKPQSEDCLTLNVWAPRNAKPKSLPVMVWIHGGSFRFGTGALSLYDGSELARRGVVVVTINYRLGIFGTFTHPALRKDGEENGNFALLDQIAALKWVRENIAGFGGNPENVTLFGESAGGVSVAYLLSAKAAKGLFHKAIIESGGLAVPLHSRAESDAIGQRLVRDMGGDNENIDAQSLRALPAQALVDVDYGPADVMPMQDDIVISRTLADAFAAGDSGDIPIIIGWNGAEAGFFGPRYWQGLPKQLGQDHWQQLKSLCYGWGLANDDAAAEQIASEWFAGNVSRQMAKTHKGPVHAYRFDWVAPDQRTAFPGAIHTAEIAYVFGHVATDPAADSQSRKLSMQMADRWVGFARSGDPQAQNALNWPQLNGDFTNFLKIGPDGQDIGGDPAAALDEAIFALKLGPRP